MEQPPNPESELTFEEELALAKALTDANDTMNHFIEAHGGFDTFVESWGNLPEQRAEYENYSDMQNKARNEFEVKVRDKTTFVKKVMESGDEELAERISMMFKIGRPKLSAAKENLFTRIFKRKEK